jgi:hypothetical protein
MVYSHGVINALIFLPSFLFAISIASPPSRIRHLGMPVSHLMSHGAVSPAFFEQTHVAENKRDFPKGLVDNFQCFQRKDLDTSRIDKPVRDFYTHTTEFELTVEARHFGVVGLLWKVFGRRLFRLADQLNLPSGDEDIASRLVWINSPMEPRKRPRGWVRSDRKTGRAIYVAAYSIHTWDDETFMNIAFPLPFCNMTSILRLEYASNAGESALKLTSLPDKFQPSDQGVYLVRNNLTIRLPLNEVITIWSENELLRARHDMWLLGMKYLSLNYFIEKKS